MIYLPAHESGYLECNVPKLSTAAYALAICFGKHFTYPEIYVLATFFMTLGEIMLLNARESEGCKPIGYGLES